MEARVILIDHNMTGEPSASRGERKKNTPEAKVIIDFFTTLWFVPFCILILYCVAFVYCPTGISLRLGLYKEHHGMNI